MNYISTLLATHGRAFVRAVLNPSIHGHDMHKGNNIICIQRLRIELDEDSV